MPVREREKVQALLFQAMSAHTNIEWCDSTINPTSGCDGCEIFETCYARELQEKRLSLAFPANYDRDFRQVRTIAGRMKQAARWRDLTGMERPEKPWLNGMPRLVFISDMSDALSKAVPFEFLRDEIITTVREWKHIGLWLTKRPERMVEFDRWLAARGESWPANLWPGTSVTSQKTANLRVHQLLRVRSTVRFLSVEPMLGPVQLDDLIVSDGNPGEWHVDCLTNEGLSGSDDPDFDGRTISWVICGGESGKKNKPGHRRPAPMHPAWPRAVRDQCRVAGVPFFFKQWGNWRPHPHPPVRGRITDYGICLAETGEWVAQGRWWDGTAQAMDCVGKELAGAILDGREWREMPRA